jgi:hypothetical protein
MEQPAYQRSPILSRGRCLKLSVRRFNEVSTLTNHTIFFAELRVVALTATSIYPGRGGPLDSLFPRNSSDEEDFQVEDEADWMDDLEQTPAKLTSKHPSKFSKSVAAEVSDIRTTLL